MRSVPTQVKSNILSFSGMSLDEPKEERVKEKLEKWKTTDLKEAMDLLGTPESVPYCRVPTLPASSHHFT
jgi:hypothetical protein